MRKKRKPLTIKQRKRISEAVKIYYSTHSGINKGKKLSTETKKKISESKKGQPSWNKGKKFSEESRRKMSLAKKNYIPWNAGLKGRQSEKQKRQFDELRKKQYGSENPNWRGGVTPENEQVRKSKMYKDWHKRIRERDRYTCQKCWTNRNIEVHHIKNFSKYSEVRMDDDNGIVLCADCHTEFHRFYGIKDNNREQLERYLNG